jgi:hypothetical protein
MAAVHPGALATGSPTEEKKKTDFSRKRTGFVWLRIGTYGGLLGTHNDPSDSVTEEGGKGADFWIG